jgi:cytochrome c-type biogenesis protein CcmH/NrfG
VSDTTALGSDDRAQLERERDFLVRSLDDLERERDKGAIDDESYTRLHDDYTARAAAVIRTLRDGVDVRPVAPPTSRRRRFLTIVGIVAFAAVLAVVLAAALGARLPGETSSGNTGDAASGTNDRNDDDGISVAERIRRLQATVTESPDDIASRLLLARFLEADGDLAGALAQYDAVLARNPSSAEAQAQAGRILYVTAQAAVRSDPEAVEGLVQQSRARLDQAVAVDPEHADARFFRAIVLANEYGAFAAAQNDLQRYLILSPQGQFVDQARRLLADVTSAIEGTAATTPTTGADRANR